MTEGRTRSGRDRRPPRGRKVSGGGGSAALPSRDEMLLFAIGWVKDRRLNGRDLLPAVAAVLEMVEIGIVGKTR